MPLPPPPATLPHPITHPTRITPRTAALPLHRQVHIADWERPLETCSVLHANKAVIDLCGAPDAGTAFIDPGAWPRLCLDRERLAGVLVKLSRWVLAMSAGTTLLNILLNLWLIPWWGAIGAAWASVGAWACSVLVLPWLAAGPRDFQRTWCGLAKPR